MDLTIIYIFVMIILSLYILLKFCGGSIKGLFTSFLNTSYTSDSYGLSPNKKKKEEDKKEKQPIKESVKEEIKEPVNKPSANAQISQVFKVKEKIEPQQKISAISETPAFIKDNKTLNIPNKNSFFPNSVTDLNSGAMPRNIAPSSLISSREKDFSPRAIQIMNENKPKQSMAYDRESIRNKLDFLFNNKNDYDENMDISSIIKRRQEPQVDIKKQFVGEINASPNPRRKKFYWM